jgi:ribosomal protein S10
MNTKLKLISLNKKSLILYNSFLLNIFNKLNIKYSIINLPKKKKIITLLKSPHVYKKARKQFEFNTYKKIINIKINLKFNTLKFLILNKPQNIKISIFKY